MLKCKKCQSDLISGNRRCLNCGTLADPLELFREEMRILIGARYPILYVVSYEEDEVVKNILSIGNKMGKKVYVWAISSGMNCISEKQVLQKAEYKGQEATSKRKNDRNPLQVLEMIDSSMENALFILKDFHLYLEDPFRQYLDNPVLIRRKLRDIVSNFKKTKKTLIILSPVLSLPPELEKNIVVMDFPLPTLNEIEEIIEQKIAAAVSKLNIAVEPELKERFAKAALGLTRSEVENVFNRALVNDRRFDENDLALIISEKKQVLRRTGLLEYCEVTEKFGNVGGLTNLKDWLVKRGKSFSEAARKFGLPEPKGILLLGVQGCGKSLISKAIAALWKLPLLRFDLGKIFGSYIGESEANLRKALKISEALAPTILWIDEIEKGFAGVGGGGSGDSGVAARVFGSFITWMQEKEAPVFIIATANDISSLPPELLRKGRFDEIFFVDLPRPEERKEILKIHLEKRNRIPDDFNLDFLAHLSDGFSGAELEQAIIAALYDAFNDKCDINTEYIRKSIEETVPLSKTMKEKIDHLRSWAASRARPAS